MKDRLSICVWRHGDDGLTARLADKVEERYMEAAAYALGCDGDPPISLRILQIKDWEKVEERIRMVVNMELEFTGKGEGVTTAAYCWEDEMNGCADGIVDWVGQVLSNAE